MSNANTTKGMTDEEVLTKYGETRKLRSDYTKTMTDTSKIGVVIFSSFIVIMAFGVFVIGLNNILIQNEMSDWEREGRAEEKRQLLEVQNAESCEEMILLVTQYTHSFWDGQINDQMIQTYKDRCVPK